MKTIPETMIQEIVRRLTAEFDPERIILFGSHAWGAPTDDSDIDLFVIVSRSDEPSNRRATRAHRCLREIDASMDLIVRTTEEMTRFGAAPASLEAQVLTEGKVIYERSHKESHAELARQGVA
jgi:predicted nucleotidyltransferase